MCQIRWGQMCRGQVNYYRLAWVPNAHEKKGKRSKKLVQEGSASNIVQHGIMKLKTKDKISTLQYCEQLIFVKG